MKNFTVLTTLFLLISLNSIAQFSNKRMRGIEVEEIGYTISVDTTTLIAKSFNVDGVKVQIQPIDASSLNNLFYDSYNLNGKFSYSYYDSSREKYFFKKIRRRDKYKTDTEYLIEGARWLQDNDLISDRLYDDIYAEVLSENDSSEFGGSVMSKSAFNPYYLGDKYLSTFEVLFENTTEEVRTCNTVFLLKTDKSSLEPLSSAAICSFQKQGVNIADIEALERYGYSNNIVVPPNSKITKYMAFLPVDLTSKKIELFFTTHSGTKKLDWQFNIDKKIINEKYFYYALKISTLFYPEYVYFHIDGDADAYIDNDILYINKEDINKSISIFYYLLDSYLYYGTIELKAADYLDFNKNKRSSIDVVLEKIDEVKKRR